MHIKKMRPKMTMEIALHQRNDYRSERDSLFELIRYIQKEWRAGHDLANLLNDDALFTMALDSYGVDSSFCNDFSYPDSWDWELEKESFKQISSLIEHLRTPPAPIVTNGRGCRVGIRVDKGTVELSQDDIFMSDGSSYSRECWKKFYPAGIYVLDIWHLARHMWTCLGQNHGAVIVQLMDLAAKGDVNEIIRRLNKLKMESASRLLKEELTKLVQYIQENKDGVENASKIKMPNLDLVSEVVHYALDISEKCFDKTEVLTPELLEEARSF